jgi:hypothetical protein
MASKSAISRTIKGTGFVAVEAGAWTLAGPLTAVVVGALMIFNAKRVERLVSDLRRRRRPSLQSIATIAVSIVIVLAVGSTERTVALNEERERQRAAQALARELAETRRRQEEIAAAALRRQEEIARENAKRDEENARKQEQSSKETRELVDRRFKETQKVLNEALGPEAMRAKALVAKYPFGYVVLDMQKSSTVTPHDSQGIRLDTSKVRYVESGNGFRLLLPEIYRGEQKFAWDNWVGMPRVVSSKPHSLAVIGKAALSIEVLAVPDTGVVVAVGLADAKRFGSASRTASPSLP